MAESFQALDLWLFRAVTPWDTPWLDSTMSWISISGTASALWLLLAALSMTRPASRGAAWRVLLAVLVSFAMVDAVLKPLVARDRPISIRAFEPPRELPPMPRSLSFPSGHTTAAFASAITVSRMWPAARALWWTLAVLMGYSRIYVGHHYPLDVAGGAILGVLIAFWVLGGRNRATYASSLPRPLPAGAVVRP